MPTGNPSWSNSPVPHLVVDLPRSGERLANPVQMIRGTTSPGNTVVVNGSPASVLPDGRYFATVELPAGSSELLVEVTDEDGNVGTVKQDVEVEDSHFFLLAMADGAFGVLKGRGHLEGAGMDDQTEYFTDGRVAVYAKGRIRGKYLITARFDTGRGEFDQLFRISGPGGNRLPPTESGSGRLLHSLWR